MIWLRLVKSSRFKGRKFRERRLKFEPDPEEIGYAFHTRRRNWAKRGFFQRSLSFRGKYGDVC